MTLPAVAAAARTALDLLASRPARLGGTRLVCLDGPAGSGKSTLAAALVAAAGARGLTTALVHTDDLLEGWSGLPGLAPRLADLVAPLTADLPGRYRRWDWVASAWAEEWTVPAVEVLVVEGVGAGSPLLDDGRALLVWVEAPPALRRERGLARDGDAFAPHWDAWARDEAELLGRERTRDRADLLVDGTGERPPQVRGG